MCLCSLLLNLETPNDEKLNIHRILKRLAKALIRLRICADWSEPLLVAHTTLLEISCLGSVNFVSESIRATMEEYSDSVVEC